MQNQKIHKFMKDESFVASKKMGQNFLSSLPIKKRIVDAASLDKTDFIIEIGPGLGAITQIILEREHQLLAIELDKRLFEFLTKKFQNNDNFNIINNDVLKTDLDTLISEYKKDKQQVKIVANLPYSISSKIVLKILKTTAIDVAIVMVQKEMAQRICAKANSKDYNAFSALLSLYLDIDYLFTVGPNNFIPKPKVDSAVIKISRKKSEEYLNTDLEQYEEFLRLAFSNKRKTLVNNLSQSYDKEIVINLLNKFELSSTIRAEALSPEWLIKLYKELYALKSICKD